jgi:hypothetical protein
LKQTKADVGAPVGSFIRKTNGGSERAGPKGFKQNTPEKMLHVAKFVNIN